MSHLSIGRSPIPMASGGRRFPISYQQEICYISGLFQPAMFEDPRFCLHLVLHLHGNLDPQILQAALDDVVARHAPLRTRLALTATGAIVQEEFGEVKSHLEVHDSGGQDVQAIIDALSNMTVPYHEVPLLRMKLVKLGPQEHLLGIAVHHVAIDGSSLFIAMQDLSRAYALRQQGQRLLPLDFTYSDYAAWQRSVTAERLEKDIAGWIELMRDCHPAPLRLDSPFVPGLALETSVLRLPFISAAESAAVERFAKRHRTSPFALFLLSVEVVLGARKDTEDRVAFSFFDMRDHPNTKEMVGHFLRPIGIRFTMASQVAVSAALRHLTQRLLEALPRAYVPSHYMLPALPDLLRCIVGASQPGPAFVHLMMHSDPDAFRLGDAQGGTVAAPFHGAREPGLSIRLLALPDQGFDIETIYEPRQFKESSIHALMNRIPSALRAILATDAAATPAQLLEQVGGW